LALTVAELRAVFSADTSGLKKGDAAVAASARNASSAYGKAGASIDQTHQKSGQFVRGMRSHLLMLAGPLAIGAVIKSSSQLEQRYSKTMKIMQASTGSTGEEMKKLDALAMKMGAQTQFSANDAAGAMLELGKAGISTSDIMGGALKGTLLLAAAGGTDLATASTIAANAMNTFNLKGSDMAKIASALAGGANASSASVESLGQGLQQVGPGAKNAGLSLQQTVGVLSAFDAAGIKGSDAGTSLKTMLANLVPQTDKARTAMSDLGLDFVDAKGNFVSITNVADQLQRKLGPLSEAQRTQALTTLFGSDATRAATVLMNQGATGLAKYIKATRDQGAAQKMANASMKGTAGAMERLSGSVETAQLALGKALAPTIEEVADWLSGKAVPAVTEFITQMQNGAGAGGEFADTLGQVRDAGAGALRVAGKLVGILNQLPGPVKKYGAEAAVAYVALNKLMKLGGIKGGLKGSLGSIVGKGAGGVAGGVLGGGVQKVFVTNPGFGSGLPGVGVPGGKPGTGVIPIGDKGRPMLGTGKVPAAESASGLKGALGSMKGLAMLLGVGGMVAGGGGSHEIKPVSAKNAKPGDLIDPSTFTKADLSRITNKNTSAYKRLAAEIAAVERGQTNANAAWSAGKGVLNETAVKTGQYSKVLKTVPKRIQSFVSTPGAVSSMGMMRNIAKQYHLTPKQIRTIMALQGYSKTQAEIVVAGKAYRSLPKGVKTAITTPGAIKSEADVNRLQKRYKLTPAQKNTVMRVSGVDAAIAKARALAVAIANVRSKSVTLETVIRRRNSSSGPALATAQADGGTVQGQRAPYGDKVLTYLAPGEEVISNARGQADRWRPTLKAINAGRMAEGGTVGSQVGSTLEVLQAMATIRDINRDLTERAKKTVGKGKHAHKVDAGPAHKGLDRMILWAQMAEAKKELTRLRGKVQADPAEAVDTSSYKEQMMGNIFSSGVTSATQLLKNLMTQEVTNQQWASLLAGLSGAGLSKGLLDQFKENGPSSQALALGQSILKTGNAAKLNNASAIIGQQSDAYAGWAGGTGKTPVAPVHIENFNANDQTPQEIGERLYFISQVRR
jgi:TP901 family phage tail tape measure protein